MRRYVRYAATGGTAVAIVVMLVVVGPATMATYGAQVAAALTERYGTAWIAAAGVVALGVMLVRRSTPRRRPARATPHRAPPHSTPPHSTRPHSTRPHPARAHHHRADGRPRLRLVRAEGQS